MFIVAGLSVIKIPIGYIVRTNLLGYVRIITSHF
nr:MAG TPA: hypothetical protein [Inoviridae sp.]